MVKVNSYVQKFPKIDSKTCTQQFYEELLNKKYSAMNFEQVMAEMSYLTVYGRQVSAGQMSNLINSYHDGRIGRFFRKHDNIKFKAMYREWKSQLPIVPL